MKWLPSIAECIPPSSSIAFGKLVHDEDLSCVKVGHPELDAMRCDQLERSGEVDPLPYIAREHRDTLGTADALFPVGSLALVRAGRIARAPTVPNMQSWLCASCGAGKSV